MMKISQSRRWGSEKTTQKLPTKTPETVEKTAEKIIRFMRSNPEITTEEVSNEIGISVSGIEKQIAKLKKQAKIKRIGADRGGHWEIIK